jgi:8-oxo-dGTP diphosphatase/2-hydroxy-dATP diphosphatase
MKPEWFSLSPTPSPSLEHDLNLEVAGNDLPPIPFSRMWETDHVWFPLLISHRKFVGRADFTQNGAELKPYKWWYGVLSPSAVPLAVGGAPLAVQNRSN